MSTVQKHSTTLVFLKDLFLDLLLFILYINELTDIEYEFGLKMHSYADDTTLYIGFNPTTEFHTLSENLKSRLIKINTWMTKNFLKLNLNKTLLLVCGKKSY